jgi:AraC family transcriptional activator of mtrCDE
MVQLLERFLAAFDVGVAAFTSCDVRHGWQLVFEPSQSASLHYCLAGTGTMSVGNGAPIAVEQHSFVLLPPRVAYSFEAGGIRTNEYRGSLRHGRIQACASGESVPTIRAGDGDEGLLTACGEVRFAQTWAANLFAGLAMPIVERFDGPDGLRDQFVMLLAEGARPRIGTRALTEALLKQCLVLLLRRQLERGAEPLPWIAALADRRLALAMAALLEHPSKPFTVEVLAQIAGMSRSAFAVQFAAIFGQSPMQLLKEVRLRRACELLVTTTLPVEAVARTVGFAGRSNFSRAFRQLFGTDPTAYRATASARERGTSRGRLISNPIDHSERRDGAGVRTSKSSKGSTDAAH